MPNFRFNPDNTEGAFPTSIDFNDAEIKKGDRILATDVVDLYDCEITIPQDGDLLVYEASSELWKNAQGGGSSCTMFRGYDGMTEANAKFVVISGGRGHTLAIKIDGTLWGTGYNYYGQLGLGNNGSGTQKNIFTQIGSDNDWIDVSCGSYHSMAIKSNGTLWGTGRNRNGELGLGDEDIRDVFTQVGSDNDWNFLSCGGGHTMVIKSDGTLWGAGYNGSGHLGLGDKIKRLVFTKVGTDNNWKIISCGGDHSISIKEDGTLWVTGYNYYGQLGIGSHGPGSEVLVFYEVPEDNDWENVFCGGNHTALIKEDGNLFVAGSNYYGQLGLGDNGSETNRDRFKYINSDIKWKMVSYGDNHAIAIKEDGTLWVTGHSYYGQLGLGWTSNKNVFTQVESDTDWNYIDCGETYSMAIKSGITYGTGTNCDGELGLGYYAECWDGLEGEHLFTNSIYIFEYTNTVFIDESSSGGDGQYDTPFTSLKDCFYWLNVCNTIPDDTTLTIIFLSDVTNTEITSLNHPQGYNIVIDGNGNSIINEQTIEYGYDQTPALETNALFIATSQYTSLLIKNDGTLWATGRNYDGQTGIPGSNLDWFTQVGFDTDWVKCYIYYNHSMALKNDGTLWATGDNGWGQLGLGDENDRDVFTQVGTDTDWVDVAVGYYHTLAIKSDGTLWSTGYNNYGQLGLGDNGYRNEFEQVETDTNWKQVSCGIWFTLAIKDDGTLWGMGENINYQIGYSSSTSNIYVPTQESTESSEWDQVSCGRYHSMAIKYDGTLWGTGRNSNYQIGIAGTSNKSFFTQTGNDEEEWEKVICGHYHTMAIKFDRTLWGAGYNYYGQLSLNHNSTLQSFTQESTESSEWLSVACSIYNSMGIKQEEEYPLFGTGRIGDGNMSIDYGSSTTYHFIQCSYGQNVIAYIKELDTLMYLNDNHNLKSIQNVDLDFDIVYDSEDYEIIDGDIIVGGIPIYEYEHEELYYDVYHTEIRNICTLGTKRISFNNKDTEIIVILVIEDEYDYYNNEYIVIYINKYSIIHKSKSIMNIDTGILDKFTINNATVTVNDIISTANWDLINDSLLVLDKEPTVSPTINNQDSTYIIDGVIQ